MATPRRLPSACGEQLDSSHVVEIRDLDRRNPERGDMLIVNGEPPNEANQGPVRIFAARVLNVGGYKLMLSLSGAPSVDDFEDLCDPMDRRTPRSGACPASTVKDLLD